MGLDIVNGDLLAASDKFICHQCNCMSRRAAHLALDVFEAFPHADVYSTRAAPDVPGAIKVLGDGKDMRYVVALFGQVYPGKPKFMTGKDTQITREGYFKSCLDKLADYVLFAPGRQGTIAFPWRIGCGAAGGDWDKYLDMIAKFSEGFDVRIYRNDTI